VALYSAEFQKIEAGSRHLRRERCLVRPKCLAATLQTPQNLRTSHFYHSNPRVSQLLAGSRPVPAEGAGFRLCGNLLKLSGTTAYGRQGALPGLHLWPLAAPSSAPAGTPSAHWGEPTPGQRLPSPAAPHPWPCIAPDLPDWPQSTAQHAVPYLTFDTSQFLMSSTTALRPQSDMSSQSIHSARNWDFETYKAWNRLLSSRGLLSLWRQP